MSHASSLTYTIMNRVIIFAGLLAALSFSPLQAQSEYPLESDVASPEAIVTATYESIARAPGAPFEWDRFRSLFIDEATLLPNTEQTGGDAKVLSPEGFIAWIEGYYEANAPIGSEQDKGFAEEAVHNEVLRYGDIAQVLSTYQKHFWGQDEILGRGINSFQLVHREDRWWVVSIAWDEENGAGPIPDQFLE